MSDFQFQLNVDIHGEGDREVEVSMPKWYSFSNINILSDTLVGSMAYTIKFVGKSSCLPDFQFSCSSVREVFMFCNVLGLEESYQSLELEIKTRTCSKRQHHAVAKLCVPWTDGFERYHHFT